MAHKKEPSTLGAILGIVFLPVAAVVAVGTGILAVAGSVIVVGLGKIGTAITNR